MNDMIDNPTDTTGHMIAASKVNGTAVYNKAAEKLGSIYDVMLDKSSGNARYAVMSFGGFLGMGEKFHPLPWNTMHYDERLGGYVVDLDRSMLEGAPSYETHDTSLWGDDTWGSRVDDYYGSPRHDDLRGGLMAGDPLATIPARI